MQDYRNTPRHLRPAKRHFPEYHIWRAIKWRCSQPHWQARGITLDPEWEDFWNFYDELGPRPSPDHSVDRKSGSGGYGPQKCRWATPKEQWENMSRTRHTKRKENRSSSYDPETGARRPATKDMPEYVCWVSMKSRCNNPNNLGYPSYGGVGIRVCPEWDADFWQFFKDVGPRPSPNHSLDRYPDPFGHYELGNVRWATAAEQASNKKYHRRIAYQGEELTAAQWSVRTGIRAQIIYTRIFEYNWEIERALTEPN